MIAVDPIVHWLLRGLLTLLFASAVVHKLRAAPAFAASIRDYRLLPSWLSWPAAGGLVAAELAVVAALAWPALDPLGPALALALLALYAAAIGVNLVRGRRHIDCGCLGPGRRSALSWWWVARNAGLAAGAALLCLELAPRALSWLDAASLLGGVAVAMLLWNAALQLHAVLPAPGRSA